MPKIAPIPTRTFEKFLTKVGCTFAGQHGDHRKWRRTGLARPVIVPVRKELPVFIISNNLRILGISHETYLKLMGK